MSNIVDKKKTNFRFTEKRNPYKKYNYAKWKWSDIFSEIDASKETKHNIFKIVSKKYNINYGTLKNKYSSHVNNKNKFNVNVENRGAVKIFNEKEEEEIYLFLKEHFIDQNRVLCNDIIKIHAINKFKELYPNEKFVACDGWCNKFKKRWKLSTVKISISKVATKSYTDEEINLFLKNCKDSLLEVGENFFLI